jgi:hypothetical protein
MEMTEPTPEEAARALREIGQRRQQVYRGSASPRWMWIVAGVLVVVYCTVSDLFPSSALWLSWSFTALVLVMAVAGRTRPGSSLLGRRVRPAGAGPFKLRLLRVLVGLAVGVACGLTVRLLHVPHGKIIYGALAGAYVVLLGPQVQAWLLDRAARS